MNLDGCAVLAHGDGKSGLVAEEPQTSSVRRGHEELAGPARAGVVQGASWCHRTINFARISSCAILALPECLTRNTVSRTGHGRKCLAGGFCHIRREAVSGVPAPRDYPRGVTLTIQMLGRSCRSRIVQHSTESRTPKPLVVNHFTPYRRRPRGPRGQVRHLGTLPSLLRLARRGGALAQFAGQKLPHSPQAQGVRMSY